MRSGRAKAELSLSAGARPRVYALCPDGSLAGEVKSEWADGKLSFTADIALWPNRATCCYEIAR